MLFYKGKNVWCLMHDFADKFFLTLREEILQDLYKQYEKIKKGQNSSELIIEIQHYSDMKIKGEESGSEISMVGQAFNSLRHWT